MRLLNRMLGWTGVALVPRHSVKALIEYGNVLETHLPSRQAKWMRRVADVMPATESDRHSQTVAHYRSEYQARQLKVSS